MECVIKKELQTSSTHIISNKILYENIKMEKEKSNIRSHKVGKYTVTEDFSECLPKEEGLKVLEEVKQILLYEAKKSMKTP